MIGRRTFVGAVVAALIVVPLATHGQPVNAVRRIGVLFPDAPDTAAEIQQISVPLGELGWVEGRNLLVERRYAVGKAELLGPLAEELVRLKVEIIVTWGTEGAWAAKNATTTIPIVLFSVGDPVRAGLAASLARPGGNITGYSVVGPEADTKRLAMLRELVPDLQRVGALEYPSNPYFRAVRKEFEQACRSLGIQPIVVEVATASELETAIPELARGRAQALIVPSEDLFIKNRVSLMSAARKFSLPIVTDGREILEAGALVSYGPSDVERRQRNAAFVDRILRGAKPADLPFEQPTRFDLVINLKAAKSLGITVPRVLLVGANEVIR